MSNPSGTDANDEPVDDGSSPETEVIDPTALAAVAGSEPDEQPERRFTAPSGFDAGKTQIIETHEPATEMMAAGDSTQPIAHSVAPQEIPGRGRIPKLTGRSRSWGWVIALVLVIAALAAVAILGTVLLTRNASPPVSEPDRTTAVSVHSPAVGAGERTQLAS